MPFDVIYDPDKEIAALIDPNAGRALGPLVSAPRDRAEQLMQTFVGGLGKDPAETHVIDLDSYWRGFLAAMADEGDEGSPEGSPSATPAAAGSAAGEAAPAGAPPAPGQVAGTVTGDAAVREAQTGEMGGTAGPSAAQGAPAEVSQGTDAPIEPPVVAAGALPPSHEQAAPAPDQPGGAGTSGGANGGTGVPLAPPQ